MKEKSWALVYIISHSAYLIWIAVMVSLGKVLPAGVYFIGGATILMITVAMLGMTVVERKASLHIEVKVKRQEDEGDLWKMGNIED